MREEVLGWKQLLKDYFEGFENSENNLSGIYGGIMTGVLIVFGAELKLGQFLCVLPVAFALLSAAAQIVSPHEHFYLVPLSRAQRKEYIRKMLKIRVIVPTVITFTITLAVAFAGGISMYAVILNSVAVFLDCLIIGMLNDGEMSEKVKSCAFGKLRIYSAVSLVICFMLSPGFILLNLHIETFARFVFVLLLWLAIWETTAVIAGKHWSEISSNFADYELSRKVVEK